MARKSKVSGSRPSPSQPVKARARGAIGATQARRALLDALPNLLYRASVDRAPAPRLSQEKETVIEREATTKGRDRPSPVPAAKTEPNAIRRGAEDERFGVCKKRPGKSAGNGTGRPFVPWCKK